VIHTRPLPERAEVKADKNGNLLNKNGEIVARAGREARMYQNLHKTKAEAKTLKGQIDDLNGRLQRAVQIGRGFHTELQTLKATSEAIKQFGLDQTEHLSALRLFKDLKDNPANAIKNLLTRAAANGINVQELGGPAGADPKSIVDLIRQELSPLKERTEQERKNAEAAQAERAQRERIQGEVNSFFAQNPEAQQYLPVFTSTMKQYPGMTLGEIWARIQLHFAQNPQDRRSKNSRGQAPRSLPSGRGAPVNSANDMAPVSDSYDAIVRDVMTKAGIS
jgi:cell division septum initiation protein DivIVA